MESSVNMREVCVYGGCDHLDTDKKYWTHKQMVDVTKKIGEELKPVFDQYDYVQLWNVVREVRLARDDSLATFLEDGSLKLDSGVIVIYAFDIVKYKRTWSWGMESS
jgi:hypothetical protein